MPTRCGKMINFCLSDRGSYRTDRHTNAPLFVDFHHIDLSRNGKKAGKTWKKKIRMQTSNQHISRRRRCRSHKSALPRCNITNNIANTYQDNNTLFSLCAIAAIEWTIVMFAMIFLWRQDVTLFFPCTNRKSHQIKKESTTENPFSIGLCTKDEWKLIRICVDNLGFGIDSRSFTNKQLINIVKSTIFT